MNNRQLIAVLVSLGLVAAGVVWKYRSNTAAAPSRELADMDKVLPDFALNDVTGIQIKNKQSEVNLARVDDTWGVKERDGYPANYDFIKDLVTKVHDLKVIESVKIGQSQLGRLQLLSPASDQVAEAKDTEVGTLIVFKKDGDQETARLLLGKTLETRSDDDNPFFNLGGASGRFVQVGGKNELAYKVKEPFTSLNVEVREWVDKQFIAPSGGLKTIAVTVTEPSDQSWKVDKEKEGADPALAEKKDEENVDADKVKQAGSAFSSAYFTDVATAAEKDKTGLDAPARTATVTFFDGFTYNFKIGNKVKPEDENSDYYLALNVTYTPTPEPTEPALAAPEEPQPTPAPEGETDEQKQEREKKDADNKAEWEKARQSVDLAKSQFEADKKKWEDDKKRKEERLAKEKKYEGRTYIVSKYTVDWFLRDRAYFLKPADAAPAAVPAPAPASSAAPAVLEPPGIQVPTPPAQPRPIEAVTPPIKIEVPPKPETPGPKPAPEPPKPEAPEPEPAPAPAPAPTPEPEQPTEPTKPELPPLPGEEEPAPAPNPTPEPAAPEAPTPEPPPADE